MAEITNTPKKIDKTSPDYIWNKIRGYCNTYHIKRDELASVTGLSKATISIYNRNASNLSVETIHRFCRAYHIETLSELVNF